MFQLSGGYGITLVHFEQNGSEQFVASDHLECMYVRAYLRHNGTSAIQYIQPELTNTFDAVEDLIGLGNATIGLYVTATSYRLCRKLTSLLKELDDKTVIIWFGPWTAEHWNLLQALTDADGYVKWEPEQTLHEVLRTVRTEWKQLNGIGCRIEELSGLVAEGLPLGDKYLGNLTRLAGPESLDYLPDPWEDVCLNSLDNLSIKWADRQGNPFYAGAGIRVHSPSRLKRNLDTVLALCDRPNPSINIEGFEIVEDEKLRAELLAVLAPYSTEVVYRIKVLWEHFTLPLAEQLQSAGISQIELVAPIEVDVIDNEDQVNLDNWQQEESDLSYSVSFSQPVEGEAGTAKWIKNWIEQGLSQTDKVYPVSATHERKHVPNL